MNTVDCIKSRRSIRRFKPDSVKHSLIEEIVSAASFFPILEKYSDYPLYRN